MGAGWDNVEIEHDQKKSNNREGKYGGGELFCRTTHKYNDGVTSTNIWQQEEQGFLIANAASGSTGCSYKPKFDKPLFRL